MLDRKGEVFLREILMVGEEQRWVSEDGVFTCGRGRCWDRGGRWSVTPHTRLTPAVIAAPINDAMPRDTFEFFKQRCVRWSSLVSMRMQEKCMCWREERLHG